jgi:hypothetical protein
MEKQEFTIKLCNWLKNFLQKRFSENYEILDVLAPPSSLSKLNNDHIKQLANYSSWDFKPDVLGILKEKKSGRLELVLLNRSTSALSLKEIGEINCYARLTDAFLVFVSSLNGVSNEVNILLLEDAIRDRVLKYGDKSIIVFGWDEKNDRLNSDSVIPFSKKDFIVN